MQVVLSEGRRRLLERKAQWVWRETLLLHKKAPETRIASSLSPIEILVCLYYGGIIRFDPRDPLGDSRDRVIISKGHGAVCMYPILADLGFFDMDELAGICRRGSFLGGIPDPGVPGFETINGSLGHGLGVGCGMALALKQKRSSRRVFVLVGDGELNEGAVWEALMFAGHHELDNLTLIVDENAKCMLNLSNKVLDLSPLAGKFHEFGWLVKDVAGHDIPVLFEALSRLLNAKSPQPRVLIAHTVKGHGVQSLVSNPMCHIQTLRPDDVDRLVEGWK